MYFLSLAIARRIVEEPEPRHAAQVALASAGQVASAVKGGPTRAAVWEDVWLGMALSTHLQPPPLLGLSAVTFAFYSEQWGLKISPATYLWHTKVKDESRPVIIESWAATHHCSRGAGGVRLSCNRQGQTCSGARWWLCTDGDLGRCATSRRVDLAPLLGKVATASSTNGFLPKA